MTKAETNDKIHRFEAAGLGKAPYSYVRFEVLKYCACPGAPVLPGASCDYCGHAIMETFYLRSADGREFHVGNECINRAGDAGLMDLIAPAVREIKAAKRTAQLEREGARIKAAREAFMAHPELFNGPHPYKWCADEGRTMGGFLSWMFANAGHSGKMKAARIVEKELAGKGE